VLLQAGGNPPAFFFYPNKGATQMRGTGGLYRPTWRDKSGKQRRCKVWWLRYSINGEAFRENSHTTVRADALTLLYQRVGDRRTGKVVGQPHKVTLKNLQDSLERRYRLKGRKSLKRMQQAFNNLKRFLHEGVKALDISKARVGQFITARLAAGAAPATVRYEVRVLNAAFSAAIKEDMLTVRPGFEVPAVQNVRTDFLSAADFTALLLELAEYLRPLVLFYFLTGWRRSEGLGLTWEAVDWESQEIRLAGTDTKSAKPKSFPFAQAPELKQLLATQWKQRNGEYIFHREGKQITQGQLRYGWLVACKRAGIADSHVHDLRRCAARNFRLAGVDEGTIMSLCGWTTRAMFDRYNIVDAADRAAAVGKRFEQSSSKAESPPSEPSDSLGSTGNN